MTNPVDEFDPFTQQDPERALTQRIRAMDLGQQTRLIDGTVVQSVGVRTGPGLRRRFRVIPPNAKPGKELNSRTTKATAQAAAKAALKKEEK
jgi:hypothetical protein